MIDDDVAAGRSAGPEDEARQVADDLCRRAGLRVVPLGTVEQVTRAAEVLREVWGGQDVLSPAVLRALEQTGSYAVGLHDPAGEMIGASAGFFAAPDARRLHSHVTGILPARRGARMGTALKLHQRAWALERGLRTISWTFDPLVARNAHLNLTRLGARVAAYLPDLYGHLGDLINRGEATDRLHVEWDVTVPWPPPAAPTPTDGAAVALGEGPAGEPTTTSVGPDAHQLLVAVPRDVEQLRAERPQVAARWRSTLRDTLLPLLDGGYRVTGFTTSGHYLLEGPR